MTVSSANNRNNYTGNGAADTYSYTFKIFSETDLLVTQRDTSDIETTLVLNTDYTVTGAGDPGGGTIILTAGNLTTDYKLTIRRVRPLTQETDVRNQGDFFPEGHEDAFDHQVMIDQQQQDELDRSLTLSETSTGVSTLLPAPEADKVLRWNGTEDALENVAPGSITLAVPASESVDADKLDVDDIIAMAAKLAVLTLTGGTLTGPLLWNESGDEYLQLPRLTTAQRDALTPASGMLIYNTTLSFYQMYHGAAWVSLTSMREVQDGTLIYVADSGAADVYVATLVPTVPAYVTGMVVRVKIANANATTTPTINVNGIGAKTIVRDGVAVLKVGDLPANYFAELQYNGTQFELLNPALLKTHTHLDSDTGGEIDYAWQHISRYEYFARYNTTTIDTNGVSSASDDKIGTAISGGGAAVSASLEEDTSWVKMSTSTVVGSLAGYRNGAYATPISDAADPVTRVGFGNRWRVRLRTDAADITDTVIWAGFTNLSPNGHVTDDTPDAHSVGFRFSTNASDTTWKCCAIAGTGSSGTFTDSGVTVVADTEYDLEVRTEAGEAKFFINKVLVATITTTLPSATQGLGWFFTIYNLAAAVNKDFYFRRLSFSHSGE